MKNSKAMVALYEDHAQAEKAVIKLQQSGFDMTQLSIVGRDYHTDEHVIGYYNLGDRMRKWGGIGAFWGSVWGLLVGSAFFLIPGIGPLLIAGPLVSSLVGALEGAVTFGGLSILGVALANIGVPQNSVLEYETEIKAGKFMLLVHGTEAEVNQAKETLGILEHKLVF